MHLLMRKSQCTTQFFNHMITWYSWKADNNVLRLHPMGQYHTDGLHRKRPDLCCHFLHIIWILHSLANWDSNMNRVQTLIYSNVEDFTKLLADMNKVLVLFSGQDAYFPIWYNLKNKNILHMKTHLNYTKTVGLLISPQTSDKCHM